MRRLAILGASGRLGQKLVSRALVKGFEVHAVARHPAAVKSANYRLTVMRSDLSPGSAFDEIMDRCDFVVWAVASSPPVNAQLLSNVVGYFRSTSADADAHGTPDAEAGSFRLLLKRFVYLSRKAADTEASQAGGLRSLFSRGERTARIEDETRAEAALRESRLPFVVLRPNALSDSFLSGQVVPAGERQAPSRAVSRTNLARFVIDLLDDDAWNGREVNVNEVDAPASAQAPGDPDA